MILVIDLGNTNIALGLYKGDSLKFHWRISTEYAKMPDEYGIEILQLLEHNNLKLSSIRGICFSSVVPPLTHRIVEACETYLNIKPLIVTSKIKLNIEIKYETPETVGADRLADAVAVHELYGGPACIIDFGTATTFNALTEKGEYLGGSILPGLRTSADALVQKTAKLPSVALEKPPSVIGRNTVHAIQAGLMFGYISLVEGMLERYKKELGHEMKVIATGGFVTFISSQTEKFDVVDPWLTLRGLQMIWELNN